MGGGRAPAGGLVQGVAAQRRCRRMFLHMTRTNVDVDDELVGRVMRRYGVASKRAAIDLALRRVDVEPLSREEALAMRGAGWEGDLGELRGDAPRSTA